jgi:putative aminopeptidase FrvX
VNSLSIERTTYLELLERLLVTSSPGGHEDEIDAVLVAEIEALGLTPERDPAGDLLCTVEGKSAQAVCLTAHKDEIGMIVKRLEEDGRLRVEPLGGCTPWKLGEGPVEILTADGPVEAVLSFGCTHVSDETQAAHQAKTQALNWESVRVDAKRSRAELTRLGVHVGSRVAVHRARKKPLHLGEYVCSYALDDKGALAILLTVLREVVQAGEPPLRTVHFAATSEEELGAASGAFALRHTGSDTLIALEVGPVEKEYDTVNDHRPILWYKDSYHTYSRTLSDGLCRLADELGFGAQRACYSSAGTDASAARKYGWAGTIACVGFPTDNTHGYEIANVEGMLNTARLLSHYLSGTQAS